MPNHVTNVVHFEKETCSDLVMRLKMSEHPDGIFDFNFFVPENIGEGEDWYTWRISNWGTKWNAYTQFELTEKDGGLVMSFDTAWSTPMAVWEAIARQFPKARITVHYADEDTGNNLGKIEISDGSADLDERSDSSVEEKLEILDVVHPESYSRCPKCEEITEAGSNTCWRCEEEE